MLKKVLISYSIFSSVYNLHLFLVLMYFFFSNFAVFISCGVISIIKKSC